MLKATTVSIESLSDSDVTQLYELFKFYYDKVEKNKFINDLNEKDKIILLRCKEKGLIRGFSTFKIISFNLHNKTMLGIFSGDTIIDENFWGTTALTLEFLLNIVSIKLQNPFKEVFWLLITKGYKTYLLLANNFQTYYPRYDKEITPNHHEFLNYAWQSLYPDDFDAESGLLKIAGKYDRLKEHVAQIGKAELANPKIDFFNAKNPNWKEGDELCCIGRVDTGLVIRYFLRNTRKLLKKYLRGLKNNLKST